MQIAFLFVFAAVLCRAQEFEVASIKASPAPPGYVYSVDNARADLRGVALKNLIMAAYRIESYQLSVPEWTSSALFDISAKLPEGADKRQFPEMLRTLLENRFRLTVHHEAVQQEVYALVTGKEGPNLKDAAPDNHFDTATLKDGSLLLRIETEDGAWTVFVKRTDLPGGRTFDAPRITMAEFARTLLPYADHPVIDATGLKGAYHVTLGVPRPQQASTPRPNRDGTIVPAASDPSGEISIFKSVQKLGLALEKRSMPVDHLIVDHVERLPTEN
jgi:uncharacterized protein (TIGR03435 family)